VILDEVMLAGSRIFILTHNHQAIDFVPNAPVAIVGLASNYTDLSTTEIAAHHHDLLLSDRNGRRLKKFCSDAHGCCASLISARMRSAAASP